MAPLRCCVRKSAADEIHEMVAEFMVFVGINVCP
jgi:hypothetical protein